MKKLLLASVAMLTMTAPIVADTLNYGYCTDEISGLGHNQANVWVAGAICIPAEQAIKFEGNKITKAFVGFGASTPKQITLFMTHDLAGEPFFEQKVRVKVNRFNEIPLILDGEEYSYAFEGKDVYIGYKIMTTQPGDYPIGFDNYTLSANPNGDWFASSLDESDLNTKWAHIGENYGNCCLRVQIEGDNLSSYQYVANLMAVQVPEFIRPGYNFDAKMSIQNNGGKDINTLGIRTVINGNEVKEQVYNFSPSLEPGKCAVIELTGFNTQTEGTNVPMEVTLTTVNGQANQAFASYSATTSLYSSPYLMKRPLVIEEGTGQWCGYCPRGIVSLETMREKYKDGSFIGIAIHRYQSDPREDVMHCESYSNFIYNYITGYPSGVANRMYKYGMMPSDTQKFYDAITQMACNAVVKVGSEYSDVSQKNLDVQVSIRSPKTLKDHGYRVALVLTEDNVGPYKQSNYYSGGSAMGGFENLSSSTPVIYNDVARDIFDWEGRANVFPATLEADQTYIYERSVSLANVDKKENGFITVLLINKDGEIENAERKPLNVKLDEVPSSSVAEVIEYDCDVLAYNGAIVVVGDKVESFDVYNMSGARVASVAGAGSVQLAKGIYVVTTKVNGKVTSHKVAL